jgi:hypothetical protein
MGGSSFERSKRARTETITLPVVLVPLALLLLRGIREVATTTSTSPTTEICRSEV